MIAFQAEALTRLAILRARHEAAGDAQRVVPLLRARLQADPLLVEAVLLLAMLAADKPAGSLLAGRDLGKGAGRA